MNSIIKLVGFIFFLVIFSTCKKDVEPNPTTDYIIYNNGEGSIGEGGGEITLKGQNSTLNEATIKIPKGALETLTYITIKDITAELPNELKSNNCKAIEFLPNNLKFKIPIEGGILLSNVDNNESPEFMQFNVQNGYAKKEYSLYDKEEHILNFNIEHFSTYIVTSLSILSSKLSKNTRYTYDLINSPTNRIPNIVGQDFYPKAKEDIRRAFERWGAYSSSFSIEFLNNSTDPDITVMFVSSCDADKIFLLTDILGCNKPVTSEGVCLYELFGKKRYILLADDYEWNTSDYYSDKLDPGYVTNIEGVAIHEIGHLFGLSDKYKSIGNPSENGCYNYLSVMGNHYTDQAPISIFQYDLSNLKNKYNVSTLSYGSPTNLNPITNTNMKYKITDIESTPLKVKVTDNAGNGVKNVTVVFSDPNKNIEILSNLTCTTDGEGIAQIEKWNLPRKSGNYTIIAGAWLDPSSVNLPCSENPKSILKTVIFNIKINEIIRDVEGNVYNTVGIGTQVWMTENLKTTRFNDVSSIPPVVSGSEWIKLSTSGYCWYDNNEVKNKNTYGALYNWHAVNTGKLCPTGWHVPTDSEWKQLESFLGMNESEVDKDNLWRGMNEGYKLKESGTSHWLSPNLGTNESEFAALPGGSRYYTDPAHFFAIGENGYYWSSTEYSKSLAYFRAVDYTILGVFRGYFDKKEGFSVRCLKDN